MNYHVFMTSISLAATWCSRVMPSDVW